MTQDNTTFTWKGAFRRADLVIGNCVLPDYLLRGVHIGAATPID
jgi:hypothetical protein